MAERLHHAMTKQQASLTRRHQTALAGRGGMLEWARMHRSGADMSGGRYLIAMAPTAAILLAHYLLYLCMCVMFCPAIV